MWPSGRPLLPAGHRSVFQANPEHVGQTRGPSCPRAPGWEMPWRTLMSIPLPLAWVGQRLQLPSRATSIADGSVSFTTRPLAGGILPFPPAARRVRAGPAAGRGPASPLAEQWPAPDATPTARGNFCDTPRDYERARAPRARGRAEARHGFASNACLQALSTKYPYGTAAAATLYWSFATEAAQRVTIPDLNPFFPKDFF